MIIKFLDNYGTEFWNLWSGEIDKIGNSYGVLT